MTPARLFVGFCAAFVVLWLLSEWPLWKMRRDERRREADKKRTHSPKEPS